MAILGEYDAATVHPNGCGGVEPRSNVHQFRRGYRCQPGRFDVYGFPLSGYSAAEPAQFPAARPDLQR